MPSRTRPHHGSDRDEILALVLPAEVLLAIEVRLGFECSAEIGSTSPKQAVMRRSQPKIAVMVVTKRCAVCHSASPADRTFGVAPGGVAFDTPEQIRANPPYGPNWAHTLWYRRARVYGTLMVLALAAGTLAALLYLLNGG